MELIEFGLKGGLIWFFNNVLFSYLGMRLTSSVQVLAALIRPHPREVKMWVQSL